MLQFSKALCNMQILYNNGVICGVRLQIANFVFLRMLLELDTVPQLEIACKNAALEMHRTT